MAAKAVFAKHPITGIVDDGIGPAHTQLERAQCHKRFESRARRIGAAQSAIEQRAIDGLIQGAPVLDIDAIDKQVGIKSRFAHKGQHLATIGVYGHERAAAVAKHVFHHFLQFDVDREHDVVAGLGLRRPELARGTAPSRSLDLLYPCLAVQVFLKALLDAQFTDVIGALVVGLYARLHIGQHFFFLLVDAADIAHDMAGSLAQRVAAE